MAKLNVTVPAVDVEVNGVKYRKVERDAQVGDIIRYMCDNYSYVTTGAFYAVEYIDECGDPYIEDNDGDDFGLCGEEFEVYAKVSDTGVVYSGVKRPAKVGERIRIVSREDCEDRYENGAEFVVDSTRSSGDVRVTIEGKGSALVLFSEYVVMEPAAAEKSTPKRLTVGDYAKVIADTKESHDYAIGSFVKIVRDDEDRQPYRAERADGTEGNFLAEKDVEPATEAEFLAQRRLKVGEFAKVVAKNGMFTEERVSVGDVVKITGDDASSRPFKTDTIDGKNAGWFTESELVRATDEEVAEAKRKLTAETTTDPRSQFAKGEKVRLISGGGKYPLNGYDNGKIYEVDTPLYVSHDCGHVIQIVGGDIPQGYAKPEQLAKLTIEVGSTVRLTIKDGEEPAYGWGGVSNGAIGKVKRINGNSARVEFPAQSRWHALLSELTLVSNAEKSQPQPEPVRFKVGEYARTLTDVRKDLPKGSIVKITRDDRDRRPFRSVLLDGSDFDFYRQDELERVDAETAKWATIGRKVNEFKDGDVVQVVDDSCLEVDGAIKNGDIVTLEYAGADMFRLQKTGVDSGNYASPRRFKLVTPVEQRFDRTELEDTKAAA